MTTPNTPEARFAVLEERSRVVVEDVQGLRHDVKELAVITTRTDTKIDLLIDGAFNHRMSPKTQAAIGAGGLIGIASAVGAFLKGMGWL